MTREDIIRMARKSGAVFPADGSYHCFTTSEDLERFFHAAYDAGVAAERRWVGLTDKEIKEIIGVLGDWGPTPIKGYTRWLFDKIEAKLKEKNT